MVNMDDDEYGYDEAFEAEAKSLTPEGALERLHSWYELDPDEAEFFPTEVHELNDVEVGLNRLSFRALVETADGRRIRVQYEEVEDPGDHWTPYDCEVTVEVLPPQPGRTLSEVLAEIQERRARRQD